MKVRINIMENKKFNPTKEQIDAAKNVFVCMAIVETLRPIIEEIQSDLLNTYPVYADAYARRAATISGAIAPEPERITHFRDMYQTTDENSCSIIYKEYDAILRREKQLGDDQPFGNCPLLMAQNQLRLAK